MDVENERETHLKNGFCARLAEQNILDRHKLCPSRPGSAAWRFESSASDVPLTSKYFALYTHGSLGIVLTACVRKAVDGSKMSGQGKKLHRLDKVHIYSVAQWPTWKVGPLWLVCISFSLDGTKSIRWRSKFTKSVGIDGFQQCDPAIVTPFK